MCHYLAGSVAPEHIDVAHLDPVKSMYFRHLVDGDEEPRQCISQDPSKSNIASFYLTTKLRPSSLRSATMSLFAVRCIPLFGTLCQPMVPFGRLIDVRWPPHQSQGRNDHEAFTGI
jgi:hypothetical protein